MAESTRQHYQLATGKGANKAPGGKPSSPQPMKKGGKVKKDRC
jgi:hypothetical protein